MRSDVAELKRNRRTEGRCEIYSKSTFQSNRIRLKKPVSQSEKLLSKQTFGTISFWVTSPWPVTWTYVIACVFGIKAGTKAGTSTDFKQVRFFSPNAKSVQAPHGFEAVKAGSPTVPGGSSLDSASLGSIGTTAVELINSFWFAAPMARTAKSPWSPRAVLSETVGRRRCFSGLRAWSCLCRAGCFCMLCICQISVKNDIIFWPWDMTAPLLHRTFEPVLGGANRFRSSGMRRTLPKYPAGCKPLGHATLFSAFAFELSNFKCNKQGSGSLLTQVPKTCTRLHRKLIWVGTFCVFHIHIHQGPASTYPPSNKHGSRVHPLFGIRDIIFRTVLTCLFFHACWREGMFFHPPSDFFNPSNHLQPHSNGLKFGPRNGRVFSGRPTVK